MRVVIIGAGGHAQVVADTLLCMKQQGQQVEPIGFLDDNPVLEQRRFLNLSVLGRTSEADRFEHDAVIVGIGNNLVRHRFFESFKEKGERFATAIHPHAVVALGAAIGEGTVVFAGAIVNTGSSIGANVILNTGATVDHHNTIEDHVHIAPGVHLGGEVTIRKGTLIGIGSTVMPGRVVGEWSVVGAGSLVTKDIREEQHVVGIPAKPFVKKSLAKHEQ